MKCTNKNAHCVNSGLTKCSVKENHMAEQILAEVEYRQVPEFENYRVGSDGTLWSNLGCRGRIRSDWRQLKCYVDQRGYVVVTLCRGEERHARTLHRLVLEAFVGPRPEGMEACHFPDRSPLNNRLDNLRWDTPKANSGDKQVHGTIVFGEQQPMAKLTNETAEQARLAYAAGASPKDLAAQYGVQLTVMTACLKGRTWKRAGGPIAAVKNLRRYKRREVAV